MPAPRIALVGTPELVTFPRFAESLLACGAEVVAVDPYDLVFALDGLRLGIEPHGSVPPAESLDAFFAPIAGSRSPVQAMALERWEAAGVPTINRVAAKRVAVDKAETSAVLLQAGIPAPRTYLVEAAPGASAVRAEMGARLRYPLVVKGRAGSLGAEVRLAHDAAGIEAAVAEFAPGPWEAILLQEFYAEAGAVDFRVIVLDGRIVAIKRRASADPATEFRTTLPGYHASAGVLEPGETELAIAAAAALGLDYAGVDIIRTAKGPRVLEVNHNPFLATTERVTGVDVAMAVALALMERATVR